MIDPIIKAMVLQPIINLEEWQTFLHNKNHLKIRLDQTINNWTTTPKLDISMG
jgi:hypothetical protein